MRRLLFIAVICIGMCGCLKTVTDGKVQYRIDPNKAAEVEQIVEDVGGIMTALVPFFPFLAPIITAGGGAYAVWKTQKPKLTKAQTKGELYHNTTGSLVVALEKFKETNPQEYVKLKERLAKMIGPEAENVIRTLRGLPPKA